MLFEKVCLHCQNFARYFLGICTTYLHAIDHRLIAFAYHLLAIAYTTAMQPETHSTQHSPFKFACRLFNLALNHVDHNPTLAKK